MNILITGGAGFQGSHLVERLSGKGHTVTVLNTMTPNSAKKKKYLEGKADIIWGSITDPEITEKAIRGKDIVFHLGARVNVDESILHPWETLETNIHGTFHVLEAVRKHGTRMILTSTCEVYGSPESVPISENAELRPMSPYAASKAGADRLCFAYAKTYGIPVTIARFFNIFGERQKEKGFGAVIPIFVGRALRNETIKVFGSGLQTRDYLHISDVTNAYEMLLDHPDEQKGEVYNFGTGVGTSIKDIAEYIAKKCNTTIEYVEGRPGEASDMIANITKVKEQFGWKPKMSFYDGLDRYIAWRQNEQEE